MSKPLIPLRQDTHSSEFAVPAEPPASRDQCINDRFADIWNLGQSAPDFGCRHVKYLGVR
jgi:hypothetical protein